MILFLLTSTCSEKEILDEMIGKIGLQLKEYVADKYNGVWESLQIMGCREKSGVC